jgi:hypothetical protein
VTCPSLIRVMYRGDYNGSQSLELPLILDNLKLQKGVEIGHKALYLIIIQITIPIYVFSVFVIPFIAPLYREVPLLFLKIGDLSKLCLYWLYSSHVVGVLNKQKPIPGCAGYEGKKSVHSRG